MPNQQEAIIEIKVFRDRGIASTRQIFGEPIPPEEFFSILAMQFAALSVQHHIPKEIYDEAVSNAYQHAKESLGGRNDE